MNGGTWDTVLYFFKTNLNKSSRLINYVLCKYFSTKKLTDFSCKGQICVKRLAMPFTMTHYYTEYQITSAYNLASINNFFNVINK